MGTFAYTGIISYIGDIGSGAGSATNPLSSFASGTLDDGDADNTFELGDTVSSGSVVNTTPTTAEYRGTALINGTEYPVFYIARDNETVVYMDDPLPTPTELTNSFFTLVLEDEASGDPFPRACFLTGTRIATPEGETAVEALQPGDPVLTAGGDTVAVKWVGKQTVSTRFGPAEHLMPIRVRAGALGDGVPVRDLTLTSDHALLVDGMLVNAGALVNGTSIHAVPLSEFDKTYCVYHVETEGHQVLLADGAPAESYINYTPRNVFDNHADYAATCGEEQAIAELSYPRVTSARLLPPSIRALIARADAA